MTTPVIYWFRQDLRTRDLPGLHAALATGAPVIPCYVHDTETPGQWAPGGASCWWLHHSLTALADTLTKLGSRLIIRSGAAEDIIPELARTLGAAQVFCSRCHEPWSASLEQRLHSGLGTLGVQFKRYPGAVLLQPEEVANQAGLPFKVFTPFWRHCRAKLALNSPIADPGAAPLPTVLDAPRKLTRVSAAIPGQSVAELELCPTKPDWASNWTSLWTPGEAGALSALQVFLDSGIEDYASGRDFPDQNCTSRLSPHLHYGELSPRMLLKACFEHLERHPENSEQIDKFLAEVGWREFSNHLLHHFPTIPEKNFKPSFNGFPWLGSEARLHAWQQGRTGYPLVDAGMRELWATGYMHNRVRMVAGSFLVKHLLISWQQGEAWFWDTLVDADLANNACSWQWIAGSGADAAPYFRIFNPTVQSKRFDAEGGYIRRWIPEIANLPDKHIHQPDKAPAEVLRAAGVSLGGNYPKPIVVHEDARRAALAAWENVRNAG